MNARIASLVLAAGSLIVTAAAGAAAAGDGTGPSVEWSTIDGGGGASAAGDVLLLGTIGQPDAGGPMTAGDWSVSGGFLLGGGGIEPLPCPADLDGSEAVDFGDLLSVLSAFGACEGCPQDLDGNGQADFGDVLAVLSAWGPCP